MNQENKVPEEVSKYMSDLAIKGNGMRSKEAYQKAAKKGWRKRRRALTHRGLAHGE